MSPATSQGERRRFACTACGKCCDRGPEIELGEAAALAGDFILSLLFRVQSTPLSDRGERAEAWWRGQGSRIPLRPAFEENRRHIALFASRRRSDRQRQRATWLMISAIVEDDGRGACPALADGLCTIHDRRPLTCRTVPLHYSRPASVLRAYLDNFVATPGYACETVDAPVILDGGKVIDADVRRDRERAVEVAKADRRWKEALLAIMDDPAAAARLGLPTYDEVLAHSDRGYASQLPMLAAWRVAERAGLLTSDAFRDVCAKQAERIEAELERRPNEELRASLARYREAV